MTLTHGSLFTGIGGFDIAAHMAGFSNAFMVEIDPYCQALLKLRFPGVPLIGDIRNVTKETFANAEGGKNNQRGLAVMDGKTATSQSLNPAVSTGNQHNGNTLTLLTAGVPCQPASIAGKRRGKDDDRWLWPEAIRVLSELQPSWAVFENPVGIGSLGEFGKVPEMGAAAADEMGGWEAAELDRICGDIEAHGYEVQTVSIPACAVEAPHERQRIFIIAHAESIGDRGRDDRQCGDSERLILKEDQKGSEARYQSQRRPVADTDTQEQGLQGEQPARGICAGGCSAEYTWERDWVEVAAELCGMDDGFPAELDGLKLTRAKHREYRLKALGNAVVWSQVYPILKAIADIERGKE